MALGDAQKSRMARSTAEGACALRAAGATLRDSELRNPDYLAADFIAPGLKATALVKLPLVRRLMPRLFEAILPGSFWFELGRTHHMDEVLLGEVRDGAEQVVFLGAGLDSRAYRLRDELATATLFEVDHPVTAAVKRERLEAIFGGMPEHVRYVHVDFNSEDVGERLAAHGFDESARSIVLWSGVTPYLEPEGVAESLRWFARATGPGSAICFDYLWKEMLDGDDSFHGAKELRKRVAAGGEPFRFGIPRGESQAFVEQFGLVLEEDLGPEDAQERLLHGAGEPYGFGGMALVRNPGNPGAEGSETPA
ncbi:MAG: SAM-dependent methyltransferase [Actinomycetota bacterium]|nr:SAM-dependent methyltransferase [Actinomycetota bacterium]